LDLPLNNNCRTSRLRIDAQNPRASQLTVMLDKESMQYKMGQHKTIYIVTRVTDIIIRSLLLVYSFGNFLAILWYSETIQPIDTIQKMTAAFTSFVICIYPLSAIQKRKAIFFYSLINVLGLGVTLYLAYQYIYGNCGSWYAGAPIIIFSMCYIYFLAKLHIQRHRQHKCFNNRV